jgi:type I restriction enzyme S subunit
MTEVWASKALDEFARFRNGKSIKPGTTGAYPVYGSNGLIGSADEFMYEAAIILGRVGAYCGSVELSEGKFWASDNTIVVEAIPDEADLWFLYYLLKDANLNQHAGGAAQPLLTQSRLKPLQFSIPPLSKQRQIASILRIYDDLIENNTRRIEILEEMARRLYEEWFVHFRFPGHDEVSFKESALGRIPEGWEVVQFGHLVDEVKGAIHPSRVAPDTPYVGLEHIPRRSVTLKEWSTADTVESSKLPFKKGDILFGKIRPYFHKVSVAPVDGICSSDTILLRVKQSEHFALALCCSSSDEFVAHATQTANGTKMPRANWKVLSQYPLVLPNEDLLKTFNNFVSDLVTQCRTLVFKKNNLRAQRDLLLPKLVSGAIDVSDIPMPEDKEVEAA